MFTQFNCMAVTSFIDVKRHHAIQKIILLVLLFSFTCLKTYAQSFPSASSCTSKDLLLVSAELNNGDICGSCTPGTTITNRHLIGYINNKTGSTRTSFAFWGTLVLTNPDGSTVSRAISRCRGPIPKNAITPIDFDTIQYTCGQSLKIINLYLAWTDASPGSVCPLNPSTINPKCGILPSIIVVAGLNADISKTDATCSAGGTITVSPYGGTAPYSITVNDVTKTVAAAYGSVTFTNLPASSTAYGISITDNTSPTHCVNNTNSRMINSPSNVSVNAGNDFAKTCTLNPNGKQIGETAEAGYSYSWSPTTGLSDASSSSPTANPSTTTTYTVTKTNTTTNCSKTDDVVVTVDVTAPTASAGSDATINCTTTSTTLSASGGVSYSWSPTTGLSNANISNPVASPASTTTYIVTVTGANGCTATDDVKVTVDKTAPTASAGSDVIINCTTTSTTLLASGGVSYSWSPTTGLSNANISNPVASPASTTTYIVTVTGANGCTATDDVKVTVDKTAPLATAGSDVTINCNTTSTTLSASGGVSYSWSPTTGLSNAAISNPVASPASTTTYIVTVTGANGCTATDDVKVTVDKTAPTANAGSDVTINCTTTSTNLSASGGVSYSWSPTTGLSNPNISNPVASPSSTTTYIVTVTGANGCTATDDVKVTVNTTAPAAPQAGTITQPSCGQSTGTITIQSPDANLTYSFDGGPFTAYPPGGYNAGIGDHNVRAKNSDGCISAETPVTINPAPAIPVIASVCLVQPTLCASSGSVTINASGGDNLQYSIDGGNTWSSSNVFSNLGSGTVGNIKVKNDDGCANDVELTCGDIVSDCSQNTTVNKSSNNTAPIESAVKTNNSKSFVTPVIKEGEINVKAYPNPFQKSINFWFVSPVNGRAIIEVYNIAGQKIGIAFDGNVKAGISNNARFNAGSGVSGMLVYRLRIADKIVRGKIQQME